MWADPAPAQYPALELIVPCHQRWEIEIAQHELPERAGRINPRVVKVAKPSQFPVKKPIHKLWPQPKRPFVESVRMLKWGVPKDSGRSDVLVAFLLSKRRGRRFHMSVPGKMVTPLK